MTGPSKTIAVVGAGILGLATARRLQERFPASTVVVFEKEADVAQHQTGHNSGVVHAGLYYPPGSLKAELCRRGAGMLRAYCDEKGLPYDTCGKLVIATSESEVTRLRDIERRALANRVPDLRWLSGEEIAAVEPFSVGVAALHSPSTAITDFVAITRSFAADFRDAGGELHVSAPVTGVENRGQQVVLSTAYGHEQSFDHVVLCAGLQSDRLATTAGDVDEPVIMPFRGEYLKLTPDRAHLVRGLIYPVPDPRYPFLGVHFTRRVDGSVDVGPNAVLATAREGYSKSDVSLTDLKDIVTYAGFWKIAREHWRQGLAEAWGSVDTRSFVRRARVYVPDLAVADVARAGAGVRAQAVDRDGSLVDDFRIHHLGRVTAVRNAPSPAATSSMAIADYVVDQVQFA